MNGPSTKRPVARRHHTVSQCYLRGFLPARKKPKLLVFDKITRRQFETSTEGVAVHKDFNRIEVDGLEADALEHDLSHFEGLLAAALRRIIEAQSIADPEDLNILLQFIGMLMLRNPRLRETMRKFHEDIAKSMMELSLATKERWEEQIAEVKAAGGLKDEPQISYEDMKRFVEKGDYKIDLRNEYQVGLELSTMDKILPILFERNWVLLKAPKGSGGFVTSDHPASLIFTDPKMRGKFYGPGLGLTGTDIFFPVSPRLGIIGAFEIPKNNEIEVDEATVASCNGRTATFADRQIYARDVNFTYLMEVGEQPRKGSRLISDSRFRKESKSKS